MTSTLAVDRGDLHRTHWICTASVAVAACAVRLTIDAFALTSNSITYAAFGDVMNCWKFFPTVDARMSYAPVWGFGNVV